MKVFCISNNSLICSIGGLGKHKAQGPALKVSNGMGPEPDPRICLSEQVLKMILIPLRVGMGGGEDRTLRTTKSDEPPSSGELVS